MPDWMDWVEGLSGGALGITKGLTAGAEPFNAWEKVRTQDLANDKSDIALRDFLALQNAREGLPDYYGNAIGAVDTGNRLAMSKGNRDIYGIDQSLAASQYLGSEGFQELVARLDPSDPEYRQKVAAALAQYDPQGGIAAYDKMGIPGMQQRNLNQQAVGSYIEAYAKRKDPGAVFVWNEDGSGSIIGSDGEITPIAPDLLVRAASMMAAKDPYAAVSQGIRDEVAISGANTNLYKGLQTGGYTPAQQVQALTQQRLLYSQEFAKAQSEVQTIMKSTEYQFADPETRMEMVRQPAQRAMAAQKRLQELSLQLQSVAAGQRPASGAPLPRAGVAPQGGSSVTTRRLPPGGAAALAAGGGAAGVGAPAGMPGYPARRVSPQDTGIRPITQSGDLGGDQWLIDMMQQSLGGQ